jgi:DNA polymerase-3 subunit gamma/tau
MTYLALARKYRPTRFVDLVAQAHVAAGLSGAVARDRVAHAYLLTGPRGVGKTSAARILAMALNCEARGNDGEPCGTCESCRRIWSGGANLDVVEIDAASNRGVDDARDLRERASYAASGAGRFKVYIIDEAHMLTREAWNALLKILEEPPPRVVFVFATTEPQKIANTAAPVLSRVQRFDFRRLGPTTIVQRLQFVAEREAIDIEPEALQLIARIARGGMRDALSMLDQAVAFGEGRISAARVRGALGLIDDEMYAELLDLVAGGDSAGVFPYVARLVEAGVDLAEFMGGAGEVLRAFLVRLLGGEPEGVTEVLREAIDRHASDHAAGDLLRMLKLLNDAEAAIRRSPNARLQVEVLLLQWTLLDRTVVLGDILNALGDVRPAKQGVATKAVPSRRRTAPPRDDAVPTPTPAPPSETGRASRAQPTAAVEGPLTMQHLGDHWPAVLDEVSRRRRMLREALTDAVPVALDGDELVIEVGGSEAHVEGLARSGAVVAGAIEAVVGRRVRTTFRSAGSEPSTSATPQVRRLDDASDREQRLRLYREKDPALDAAAEALDLELLE